jgi:polysaccharide export outer membrane protein
MRRRYTFLFFFLSIFVQNQTFDLLLAHAEDGAGEADIYTVRIGDKLDIQVYKEKDLSGIFTVTSSGKIYYPMIGEVTAEGVLLEEFKRNLTTQLGEYLNEPKVQVEFSESPTKSITILGQVNKPGNFLLTPKLTLVKLISQVGGFKDNADMNSVKMVRIEKTGKKSYKQIDVKNIIKGEADDILLAPGDMIYVDKFIPQKEEGEEVKKPAIKTISVLGQVAHPGNYEYKPEKTLIKLISEFGGFKAIATTNRVKLIRKDKSGKPRLILVNASRILNGKAPDMALQPDDLIVVEETLF